MKNKLKGFTLIEMIISMGILVVFLSVLMSAFGSIIDVQLESEKGSSVDQDGRYILAKLTHDFQSASSIVSPAAPGSSSTLTLTNSTNSQNYTYSLNGGNLQVTAGGTSNNLNSVSTSISNLNFQRIGNSGSSDTVQVSFTVNSLTLLNGATETRNFQTTLGLQ